MNVWAARAEIRQPCGDLLGIVGAPCFIKGGHTRLNAIRVAALVDENLTQFGSNLDRVERPFGAEK